MFSIHSPSNTGPAMAVVTSQPIVVTSFPKMWLTPCHVPGTGKTYNARVWFLREKKAPLASAGPQHFPFTMSQHPQRTSISLESKSVTTAPRLGYTEALMWGFNKLSNIFMKDKGSEYKREKKPK